MVSEMIQQKTVQSSRESMESEPVSFPSDWKINKLGSLFEFKNGLNKEKEYFGYGTPILNYMDVYGYSGITANDINGKVFVSSDEISAYSLRKGDVFFTRTSETVDEIGVSTVLLEDVQNGVFSGFVLRGRPKSKVLDHGFKKYCFSSAHVRKQISSTSSYTTRALTNGTLLSKVILAYPSCNKEQKAIANALSDVDALITSLEKLIAKKRAIKTAAMQQLLTGKKRLPPFDKIHTGYKQTELGEIPVDWEVKNFADLAAPKNTRINPKGTGGKEFCIELEHVDQGTGVIIGSTLTTSESSLKNLFSEGDILFGKLRSYLRKYWRADRAGVCSTEIWVFKVNEQSAISQFIFQTVQTDEFIDCTSESYGTHMPRSDWKVVKSFLVATPSIDEQISITNVLSDMDQEIIALSNRLNKTKKLKQGMMQELLTGRTRLV